MLGNATPTPFDLRFSLFGIPVRVHPFFWLFSAAMGWDGEEPMYTLLWVACVFLSILVHEFGHALTARHFGWPPEVVLYSFGGYAQFYPGRGHTMQRAVLVLLAGPGAGFLLFGAVWCTQWLLINSHSLPTDPQARLKVAFVLFQMKYINLWWGLVNLLPVYPLDGGQIARHVLEHYRRDGFEVSLKLSLLVGGAVAAWFLMHEQTWPGILFGALADESLQHLQGSRSV